MHTDDLHGAHPRAARMHTDDLHALPLASLPPYPRPALPHSASCPKVESAQVQQPASPPPPPQAAPLDGPFLLSPPPLR